MQNYYMYHGGSNFGRTGGGPFITTSYDYDAPIDEYGLPRFHKWEHLKELQGEIRLCEKALLGGQCTNLSLSPLLEANVYADSSGICVAFISNAGSKSNAVVEFRI